MVNHLLSNDSKPLGPSTKRISLQVEYEGTHYMGFQFQPDQPTIQGELEKAIQSLTGKTTRIRGASRTDSGVHAYGQIVDGVIKDKYSIHTVLKALNHYLPSDIKITKAYDVSESFHSRRDAHSRVYRYHILNRSEPSPIRRRTHYLIQDQLDDSRMSQAAQDLIGTHDFKQFTKGINNYTSTIREVLRWDVRRFGDIITIECEGNGFLRQQIRRANAILVEIGKNKWPDTSIKDTLDNKFEKSKSHTVLPALGLCLVEVKYYNFWDKVINKHETS